ncbi:uncharacterized protein SPPG_06211 [Spizellomyces punctatus DAOM BR117]|uniref:Uncharacterized protein n=1 Tax=Spizellomyces punctatus (strain DAOM BR117) TaxID=645134 RepID=A0A0L0HC55_SPIPD|nr:uncharacterized protein SPPG_06211 [Spizellomyces punctatus DAOM BR117]KNC98516.1 hypothetical protein SPPG_06211 [Spizellomyces punctatus DAOM BR117]|eukprot:XP_016606556.1 hypothetical protein SPPG_06211 [Spizellomyces punctatus DAOM BR117]
MTSPPLPPKTTLYGSPPSAAATYSNPSIAPSQRTTSKLLQKWDSVTWAQVAVTLSVLQGIIISCLEFYVIAKVNDFLDDAFTEKLSLPIVNVYFALFIVALVFQAVLTYEATIHKNTMQTIAVVVFNIASLGYSVIQINQINDLRRCSEQWIKYWNDYARASGPEDATRIYYSTYVPENSECRARPYGLNPKSSNTTQVWSDAQKEPIEVPIVYDMRDQVQHVQNALDALKPVDSVTYAIIALMVIVVVLSCFVAYKVYQEYGWRIFQAQGASIQKKQMLRRVHLFILFLKLNVYFSIGIVAQVVTATIYFQKSSAPDCQRDTVDCFRRSERVKYIVLPSMVIFGVAALTYYALGWFAIRRTHRGAMYTFLGVYLANIGALVYVIGFFSQNEETQATRKWLLSFASIQLVLNLLTIANAVWCLTDFDKGLGDVVITRKDMEMAAAKPRPRLELD